MVEPDILSDLIEAADSLEDMPTKDVEALLRRAIEAIETLRTLVGRAEVVIDEAPPAGRA